MIKKINIALAVVFAVLFGFKCLLDMATAAKSRTRPAPSAAQQGAPAASELAPHIYYVYRQGFYAPNRITNRNGTVMDVMKAVFPRAEFRPLRTGLSVAEIEKILADDPQGAIVEVGWRDASGRFPHSKTPVSMSALSLFLRRDCAWTYAGPESLDKLRIGWTGEMNYSPVLRKFAEKWKNTPGKAVVSSSFNYPYLVFEQDLTAAKLDAFVYYSASGYYMQDTVIRYRRSMPFDILPLHLCVSDKDPEYAQRLLAEYEAGMERIGANGELMRIAGYYVDQLPEDVRKRAVEFMRNHTQRLSSKLIPNTSKEQ